MSGLEIIGVAASILQIAEMGRKLSIKLFYFGRRIKDANQAIQSLSSDVSLTCSALHELGTALEQDDQTKVCSEQAFHTATSILEECKNVFQNIEDAIDKQNPGPGASRIQRGIRQVTIAFFGPDLDILKGNLERLKSTMLLMLNVIMYAAQLRRRAEPSTLENNREIIQTLLEDRKSDMDGFIQLHTTKSIDKTSDDDSTLVSTRSTTLENKQSQEQQSSPDGELLKYYTLVKNLLQSIDDCQSGLTQVRHSRIRNGVVSLHAFEASLFQHDYGDTAVQIFDHPIFRRQDDQHDIDPSIDAAEVRCRASHSDSAASSPLERPESSSSSDRSMIYQSRRESLRSRSRDRSRFTGAYPDISRDSIGLVEYGDHPVHQLLPTSDYYGVPHRHGAICDNHSDELLSLEQYSSRIPHSVPLSYESRPMDKPVYHAEFAELSSTEQTGGSGELEDLISQWTNLTVNEMQLNNEDFQQSMWM